jgi:bacterioferritin-associated ferredoxin
MYVCLCKAITEQQLKDAVDQGYSYAEIRKELKLATDCGYCGKNAKNLVNQYMGDMPNCEFAEAV